MFGVNYLNDYTLTEGYEWFETKQEAIDFALEAKEYCQVADRITDEEWLDGWVTFFVGYTYDEIKELF